MRNQRWVFLLDCLTHLTQLVFHLVQLQPSHRVAVLDVLLHVLLLPKLKVARKQLKLLEWEHLVEEHVACVVFVQLHLNFVCVWRRDSAVEELDQHCQVVSKRRVQPLTFLHILVEQHVTRVLVQEKVVFLAQQLNFHNAWRFVWALKTRE